MRVFAFIAGVVLAQNLSAADPLLVPLFTPTPEFPQELVKTRYTGKVRAHLWIKSDGLVREVRVIESGHPGLTEAAQKALRQWRYKPWIGTVGAPSQTDITMPILFGSHGYRAFNTEVTLGLGNIRCAYLNHEIDAARQDFPDEPLSKVDVFWYTAQHLFGHHVALGHTEGQRKALLEQLGNAIPAIVRACKRHPDRHYGDYLPTPIRTLLIGVAQSDDSPGVTPEAKK